MVAGFDRYYQIVKCFRDEDLRADRQPEFTQIDIETSFLGRGRDPGLMDEALIRASVSKRGARRRAAGPFPRMTYAEAMSRYGSRQARPARHARAHRAHRRRCATVDFKVFRGRGGPGRRARRGAARARRHAQLTRKEIDDYTAFVGDLRRQGAGVHQGERPGEAVRGRAAVADREVPLAGRAGDDPRAHRRAGRRPALLRRGPARRSSTTRWARCASKIGPRARATLEPGWRPLWVVDFPMFEYDEEAQRWAAMHHPFTAPKDGHEDLLASDPGQALAKALRHGAERLGDRRRLGAYPPRRGAGEGVPRARHLRRGAARASSASCSTPCNTALRRTAASPSAWTASSP